MINEINCQSVKEFLDYLIPWGENPLSEGLIYRGHADSDYKLLPSALREESLSAMRLMSSGRIDLHGVKEHTDYEQAFLEYQLIRDFYRLADERGLAVPPSAMLRKEIHSTVDLISMFKWKDGESWLPDELLDPAALAQHYGVPTRLLDWTYNPFVAAYFASERPSHSAEKLCIWGFEVNNNALNSTLFGEDSPLKIVHPPYSGNPNLAAQRGLFTHVSNKIKDINNVANDVASNTSKPVDRKGFDEHVLKIIGGRVNRRINVFTKLTLPASQSDQLAKALRALGYGPARVYPGFGGVAEEIKQRPRFRKTTELKVFKPESN